MISTLAVEFAKEVLSDAHQTFLLAGDLADRGAADSGLRIGRGYTAAQRNRDHSRTASR
jgi:hypothetical protein